MKKEILLPWIKMVWWKNQIPTVSLGDKTDFSADSNNMN